MKLALLFPPDVPYMSAHALATGDSMAKTDIWITAINDRYKYHLVLVMHSADWEKRQQKRCTAANRRLNDHVDANFDGHK